MINLIFLDCGCTEEGSASGNLCDQSSGQCACKSGFCGRRCQGRQKLDTNINFKTKHGQNSS